MNNKQLSAAALASILVGGAVAEDYLRETEGFYCSPLPCSAQRALPPSWTPHGPDADPSSGARPFTTLVVAPTGSSVGASAAFGGSGGFGASGGLGPTGPTGSTTFGGSAGFVPTGPAGPTGGSTFSSQRA
jgi:hypothetical protein